VSQVKLGKSRAVGSLVLQSELSTWMHGHDGAVHHGMFMGKSRTLQWFFTRIFTCHCCAICTFTFLTFTCGEITRFCLPVWILSWDKVSSSHWSLLYKFCTWSEKQNNMWHDEVNISLILQDRASAFLLVNLKYMVHECGKAQLRNFKSLWVNNFYFSLVQALDKDCLHCADLK
jgi:hypothetical protein